MPGAARSPGRRRSPLRPSTRPSPAGRARARPFRRHASASSRWWAVKKRKATSSLTCWPWLWSTSSATASAVVSASLTAAWNACGEGRRHAGQSPGQATATATVRASAGRVRTRAICDSTSVIARAAAPLLSDACAFRGPAPPSPPPSAAPRRRAASPRRHRPALQAARDDQVEVAQVRRHVQRHARAGETPRRMRTPIAQTFASSQRPRSSRPDADGARVASAPCTPNSASVRSTASPARGRTRRRSGAWSFRRTIG